MLILLYTGMYILFILIDIIPIIRNHQWKVFGVYSVLFLFTYIITIMSIQGIKIFSPTVPIEKIVQSIIGK